MHFAAAARPYGGTTRTTQRPTAPELLSRVDQVVEREGVGHLPPAVAQWGGRDVRRSGFRRPSTIRRWPSVTRSRRSTLRTSWRCDYGATVSVVKGISFWISSNGSGSALERASSL